jgi:hypothetical protein
MSKSKQLKVGKTAFFVVASYLIECGFYGFLEDSGEKKNKRVGGRL